MNTISTLKNIAHISAGHSFRGKIPENDGSGIRVVQLKNVSPNMINWQECIETNLTGKATPKFLETGDILFAARGRHYYAVHVINENNPFKSVAAPHFYIIKANPSIVMPEFLTWQLNQSPMQRYFKRAEGTLTKSIPRNLLENTPITLPPLDEQQKIAQLAATILQEQHTLQKLIDNSAQLMNAIAIQLLNKEPS